MPRFVGGSRLGLSSVFAALMLAATPALGASKPKVPPGRDPGGIAIALIGAGIDVRRPEIAPRLARDGEGELIGWDFADNDRVPFSERDADDRAARMVLAEAPAARLIPLRVAIPAADRIPAALRWAAETPARIVLILADAGERLPRAGLAEAARHLPRLLLVVPASRTIGAAGSADVGGFLIAGADGDGTGDVSVTVPPEPDGEIAAGDLAAARIAALAARVLAREPTLDGAGLRVRILSIAKSRPTGPPLIPHPGRDGPQE